jgi:hypothetical protein
MKNINGLFNQLIIRAHILSFQSTNLKCTSVYSNITQLNLCHLIHKLLSSKTQYWKSYCRKKCLLTWVVVVCRVGMRGDNEPGFCGELFRDLVERVAGGLGTAVTDVFSVSSDSTSNCSASSCSRSKHPFMIHLWFPCYQMCSSPCY